MTRVVPILLYHRVSDRPDDPFAVAPEQYADHVDAIVASGRTPLTISEVADGLRGIRPLPERPVAVTFDDGYLDTPKAIDTLTAAGLRATVYITTGRVNTGDGLRSEQVRALANLNQTVELGAHTVSHPRLDELSTEQARREITESKRALESMIDRPVRTFAYPHGAYDARSRRLVIEAGFASAAAVKNALSHDRDDPWAVARWTVTEHTATPHVKAFLDGRHQLAWPGERLRTRASRAVRRSRRRLRGAA